MTPVAPVAVAAHRTASSALDQVGSDRARRRRRRARHSWSAVAALVVVAAVWLVPLVGICFTALKSPSEAFSSGPLAPPRSPTFSNFPNAWSSGDLGAFGLRSLIITIVKVPMGLLMSAMAAFAF